MLPETVENRAIEMIIKGADPIEAVKRALLDEMNMIGSLFDGSQLSNRGKIASDKILKTITNKYY